MIGDKLRRIADAVDEITSQNIPTDPRSGEATQEWCYEQERKLLSAGAWRAEVRGDCMGNVFVDLDVRSP